MSRSKHNALRKGHELLLLSSRQCKALTFPPPPFDSTCQELDKAVCRWLASLFSKTNFQGTEVVTCEKSHKLDFCSLSTVKVEQGFSFLTYSGKAFVSSDCSILVPATSVRVLPWQQSRQTMVFFCCFFYNRPSQYSSKSRVHQLQNGWDAPCPRSAQLRLNARQSSRHSLTHVQCEQGTKVVS